MKKVWLLENEQSRWFEFEEPHDMPSDVTVTMLTETGQPAQQKAVAWMYVNTDGECEQIEYGEAFDEPDVTLLYESPPPQRPWVGLTKEEVDSWKLPDCPTVFEFVQFIENKIKDRNT